MGKGPPPTRASLQQQQQQQPLPALPVALEARRPLPQPRLPDVLEHMTATSAARDPALLLAANTHQLLSAAAPQGHSLRPKFQPPLPPGPPPARHLHNGNAYMGHPPPSTGGDVYHPPAPMGVRFHDPGRAQPQPRPGLQHPDLLPMQHPLRQLQQQQPEAMFVQRGPVAELEQLHPWKLSLPGGVGRSGQPPSAAPRLDAFASLGMGPGAGAPPPPLPPYPSMHSQFHEQHASLPLGVGARGRGSKRHCAFYRTPSGCRNGTRCEYLHEGRVSMALNLEAAGAAGRKSKVDGLHKRGVALAEGLIHGCPLVPVAWDPLAVYQADDYFCFGT
eukprot:SM000162S02366  [mRNA]  locus=s162:150544:153153:+ [translate_table: standard]